MIPRTACWWQGQDRGRWGRGAARQEVGDEDACHAQVAAAFIYSESDSDFSNSTRFRIRMHV